MRPHMPQLVLSVCGSEHTAPQATWPVGHTSVQAPATQLWPAAHTRPHAPQLVGSVASVEHERVHMVWPAPQVERHVPSPQSWPAAHARPQDPQFAGSLATTTQVVPQRAWPVGQGSPQRPAEHTSPAAQLVPQRPQFMELMRVSTSQPLEAVPSQLAKPVVHAPMAHAPATHAAVELAPATQRLPHAPQWARVVRVLVSHPLAALPSQSAKPVRHEKPHAPAAQVASALAGAGHTVPHAPQWAGVVRVLVSHPLAGLASQLPKPLAHTPTSHAPMRHTGEALSTAGHAPPHAPQWVTSFWRLVSQPSPIARLQSP
jgi:hypothetical protein